MSTWAVTSAKFEICDQVQFDAQQWEVTGVHTASSGYFYDLTWGISSMSRVCETELEMHQERMPWDVWPPDPEEELAQTGSERLIDLEIVMKTASSPNKGSR